MTTTTKPASRETNPADPYGEVRPNGALGVLAVPDGPPSHGTGRETIRPDVIATDFPRRARDTWSPSRSTCGSMNKASWWFVDC